MTQPCECLKVQPLDDGTWQCIMGDCRRRFIPADVIEAEPQLPVREPDPAQVDRPELLHPVVL